MNKRLKIAFIILKLCKAKKIKPIRKNKTTTHKVGDLEELIMYRTKKPSIEVVECAGNNKGCDRA